MAFPVATRTRLSVMYIRTLPVLLEFKTLPSSLSRRSQCTASNRPWRADIIKLMRCNSFVWDTNRLVKVPLCLIRHHVRNSYGGEKVHLDAVFTSVRGEHRCVNGPLAAKRRDKNGEICVQCYTGRRHALGMRLNRCKSDSKTSVTFHHRATSNGTQQGIVTNINTG